MRIFYKLTDKELLDKRNKIVKDNAIPSLMKKGFEKSPFSTSWYGRNNLGDFDYELCRINEKSQLEILRIYVSRSDRWIKFILNIFQLNPTVTTVKDLNGMDGLKFRVPPNSLTEMKFRSDDIKGPPIFKLSYMYGHRLNAFYTKSGLEKNIRRLTNTIEMDIVNLESFINRWHELHRVKTIHWTG
jgi:hypothetical protein